MFGLNEAMLSFLRRQIGLRTDSANSSGSVHAKLGDLKKFVSNDLTTTINNLPYTKKVPFFKIGGISIQGDTWTTVLEITGKKGWLYDAVVRHPTSDYSHLIRITIDGQVILYTSADYGNRLGGILNMRYLNIAEDDSAPSTYYNFEGKSYDLGERSSDWSVNLISGFSSTYISRGQMRIIDPIRFNNSLKVELQYSRTDNSFTAKHQITGMTLN